LPDLSGKVIVIKSDQEEARKCYENSLKTKRSVVMVIERPPASDSSAEEEPEEAMLDASVGATLMEEDFSNESLAENVQKERPRPEDYIVERQIGGKVFKLGRFLSQEEREEVVAVISRHLDAFAWNAADMPSIDPDFLCHRLTMDAKVRPVRQRRRKFNEERCLVVKEETQKLLSAGLIREIQYPEWLANVVLLKKANGK